MLEDHIFKQRIKLYTLAAVIGVISGLAAVSFRFLIFGASFLFLVIPQVLGLWGWVLMPGVGGIVVAFLTIRYAQEAKGHGVPEVIAAYTYKGGLMKGRTPIIKSIASAICIGSGGSVGREGPIAQIGAGAGSVFATKLDLSRKERKALLVCGLSSGIAATFNAPLGGTLFGIEVLAGGIIGFSIVPIILASVIATAVATTLIPTGVSFQAPLFTMGNPLELIFYLILGAIFGLVSVLWIRGFYTFEDILEKIPISKYALPALGGILTGTLAVLVIAIENASGYSGLFNGEPYTPAISGVGYAFIDATLVGGVGIVILILFGLLKFLATSFTLGSGGSGGVFAPTLFIGAAFGGALGLVFAEIVPWLVTASMAFALVGMAALLAGTARAPITCIVIVMEMTNDYSLILPLMIAVSSSYLLSSLIEDSSIYTMKLSRRGLKPIQGLHIGALQSIEVSKVMTKEPTILRPDMTRSEVLEIIDRTHHTKYPVVDEDGKVIGILIAEDLFHDSDSEDDEPLVKEMMSTKFLHLSPSCRMDAALHAMIERDEGHAVIVDPMDPEIMIGYITKADVLKAYELAIFELRQQGIDIDEIGPADLV